MDFLAGIKGKDFVLVCGDTRAVQSIVQMKNTEDKLVPIDDHKLFGLSGEAGDRVNFSQYLIANIKLYALRNDMSMSTKAIASYTRNELATALRKNPYQTNLLLAGYDKGVGPSLYWCDYLATLHQMNVCATGYGAYFVLSLFDRHWTPDITREQAVDLMRKGVEEIKERLVVAPPKFLVKIVDSTGIQIVGDMAGTERAQDETAALSCTHVQL